MTSSLLDEITSYYGRLSSRDRGLLAVMAVAFAAFLVLVAGMGMGRAASKREQRITAKTGQLREAAQLAASFNQAEAARSELEAKLRGNKVNLFSYLADLGKRNGLDIGDMTEKGTSPLGEAKDSKIMQSSVEVTLAHVPIDKLTKFLNDVEGAQGVVKVTHLQVRPRDDGSALLDAWLTVATYSMAGS